MKRYYAGVDWADREHQVYVVDENGKKIMESNVQQTAEGLAAFGRWLDERRAEGIELWAAIEKPHGRIVDFVLDHGVRHLTAARLFYDVNDEEKTVSVLAFGVKEGNRLFIGGEEFEL